MSTGVDQIRGAFFVFFKWKCSFIFLLDAAFNFWNKPWANTANAQAIVSKTSQFTFDLIGFVRHFLSSFVQTINDSKNSVSNWVMKLNIFHLTLLVNFSSKLFFKTLEKLLALQTNEVQTFYASTVRKSVGNAFSSELET